MNAPPAWTLLVDPVPGIVTARAVALLAQLSLGQARIEVVNVDCTTHVAGVATQVLRYTCELHPPDGHNPVPHKGITVYGLT
ncbi:MAG: hypothetical protein ACHREM_24410 [Polyangiales bacterium]